MTEKLLKLRLVSETKETKMPCIGKQFSWLLMHYLKGDSICLSGGFAREVFGDNKKVSASTQ